MLYACMQMCMSLYRCVCMYPDMHVCICAFLSACKHTDVHACLISCMPVSFKACMHVYTLLYSLHKVNMHAVYACT